MFTRNNIRHNFDPKPPYGYNGYFLNSPQYQYSKQGVAILVKEGIPHKIVFSNITLLTIAIEILFDPKLTIINTYIPPKQSFSCSDILNILNKTQNPILWGFWGSLLSNDRGTKIEDVLLSSNLIVLNDGSPTHFSTHQSFTHVDVTTCSSNIFPLCSWKVLRDLHGSDHFPLMIEIGFHPDMPRKSLNQFFLHIKPIGRNTKISAHQYLVNSLFRVILIKRPQL